MEFREWIYNEIDWEGDWSDVSKECLDMDALVAYLNAVRSNKDKKTKDREKFPATMPFIHAKSKLFKDGDLDVDDFISRITAKPHNVVNRNEKMEKSGMPNEFVYKTGVPALRGIVYDIEGDRFYVVNTCPGAGDCIIKCYARKGNYIRYAESYDSMTRRLNYMLNFPESYEEMLYEELKEKCEEHGALKGYEPVVLFRWNDSGDFFSKRYRVMSHRVMRRLHKDGYNIRDGAYTKVADAVNDPEMTASVAYSSGGKESEARKVSVDGKASKVIPDHLFKGLDLRKIDDKNKLKSIVSEKFGLKLGDILTYGEMIRMSDLGVPKWHVIVTPNDGDDAIYRGDVKTILLTQH